MVVTRLPVEDGGVATGYVMIRQPLYQVIRPILVEESLQIIDRPYLRVVQPEDAADLQPLVNVVPINNRGREPVIPVDEGEVEFGVGGKSRQRLVRRFNQERDLVLRNGDLAHVLPCQLDAGFVDRDARVMSCQSGEGHGRVAAAGLYRAMVVAHVVRQKADDLSRNGVTGGPRRDEDAAAGDQRGVLFRHHVQVRVFGHQSLDGLLWCHKHS